MSVIIPDDEQETQESSIPGERLFQVSDSDLATLERWVPYLASRIDMERMSEREIREAFEMVKAVLSNVRWNYGPPTLIDESEDV